MLPCSAIKWESAFSPKVSAGTNYLTQNSSSAQRHRLQVSRSGSFVIMEAEQTFYEAARVELTYNGAVVGNGSLGKYKQ
jgi:hypothetical protein